MSLRTRIRHPLSRRDSYYGDPTVLNVRADELQVGDHLHGMGRVGFIAVVSGLESEHPFIFLYDGSGRDLGTFEGDEMVPIRLAGGAS